jgi:DNA-binding response OmpR family regulator
LEADYGGVGERDMLRVLVVDDDPDICLLTRRLLTTLGCESFDAKNGIDAEELVRTLRPDLVLLDIMMPIQDGYETCRKMRSQGYNGTVIMISALQEQAEKVKTHESGANAYIQKPITKQVLSLHVDHVRTRPETRP